MESFERTTKEVLAHIGQYSEYLPSQMTVSLSDRRQGGGFALTVGWMRPHSLTVCMLSHPTSASHATQGAVLLRFGFIGLIVRRAYRPKLKGWLFFLFFCSITQSTQKSSICQQTPSCQLRMEMTSERLSQLVRSQLPLTRTLSAPH